MRENGNRGTAHGHANVMLLLGAESRAARSTGSGPGSTRRTSYENRDLAVTTDFRDVFAEILDKRMGVTNLAPIFPGYEIDGKKRLGLIA